MLHATVIGIATHHTSSLRASFFNSVLCLLFVLFCEIRGMETLSTVCNTQHICNFGESSIEVLTATGKKEDVFFSLLFCYADDFARNAIIRRNR